MRLKIYVLLLLLVELYVILVGVAIGMPVNDFNESEDLEVMVFRRNLAYVVHDVLAERSRA